MAIYLLLSHCVWAFALTVQSTAGFSTIYNQSLFFPLYTPSQGFISIWTRVVIPNNGPSTSSYQVNSIEIAVRHPSQQDLPSTTWAVAIYSADASGEVGNKLKEVRITNASLAYTQNLPNFPQGTRHSWTLSSPLAVTPGQSFWVAFFTTLPQPNTIAVFACTNNCPGGTPPPFKIATSNQVLASGADYGPWLQNQQPIFVNMWLSLQYEDSAAQPPLSTSVTSITAGSTSAYQTYQVDVGNKTAASFVPSSYQQGVSIWGLMNPWTAPSPGGVGHRVVAFGVTLYHESTTSDLAGSYRMLLYEATVDGLPGPLIGQASRSSFPPPPTAFTFKTHEFTPSTPIPITPGRAYFLALFGAPSPPNGPAVEVKVAGTNNCGGTGDCAPVFLYVGSALADGTPPDPGQPGEVFFARSSNGLLFTFAMYARVAFESTIPPPTTLSTVTATGGIPPGSSSSSTSSSTSAATATSTSTSSTRAASSTSSTSAATAAITSSSSTHAVNTSTSASSATATTTFSFTTTLATSSSSSSSTSTSIVNGPAFTSSSSSSSALSSTSTSSTFRASTITASTTAAASASTDSSTAGDDGSSVPGWAIALIVLLVFLMVAILVAVVVFFMRRNSQAKEQKKKRKSLSHL